MKQQLRLNQRRRPRWMRLVLLLRTTSWIGQTTWMSSLDASNQDSGGYGSSLVKMVGARPIADTERQRFEGVLDWMIASVFIMNGYGEYGRDDILNLLNLVRNGTN